MKKFVKALLLVPALMLTGCNLSKEDAINSMMSGEGGGNSQGGGGTGFNLSMAEGGHSAVKTLSEREGGVSITFNYKSYVDSEEIRGASVTLSRVQSVEWATVNAFYMDGTERVEQTIGGAIDIHEGAQEGIDAYYLNPETNGYEYYGTTYDENVRLLTETFTFEMLEEWLTLDNAYLAAAIYLGIDGTIGGIIAGQQCMEFTLNAANCSELISILGNNYTLTFSFSLSTRLLMKVHLTQYQYDNEGVPTIYQENVDVSGFTTAGLVPSLTKNA